jgi:hypothetical protein
LPASIAAPTACLAIPGPLAGAESVLRDFGPVRVRGACSRGNGLGTREERLAPCYCSGLWCVPAVPAFGANCDARARARAYRGIEKLGTREHSLHILINHVVICSQAVPKLFPLGTRWDRSDRAGGGRDILGLGYRPALALRSSIARIRGQNVGMVGDSFRVFGARAGELGAADQGAGSIGRNGGNQPFLQGSAVRVGSLMLEAWAQGAGIAAISDARHKPSRLRPVTWWRAARPGRPIEGRAARVPAGPPLPPSRPSSSPARWRSSLSEIGTASGRAARQCTFRAIRDRCLAGCAKLEAGLTGRGRSGEPREAGNSAAGRGMTRCVRRFAGEPALRRMMNANAGGLCVN